MAASDNVLRGGLTPKHVDVGELLARARPDARARCRSLAARGRRGGVGALRRAGVPDFALLHVARPTAARRSTSPLDGVAIALATAGEVTVDRRTSATTSTLRPGGAVLVTPDEGVAARSRATARSSSPQPGR